MAVGSKMTKNPINSNSTEFDKGYEKGHALAILQCGISLASVVALGALGFTAYHIVQLGHHAKDKPGVEQKFDSFIAQEQSQLEKELADCGNEFFTKVTDIKEKLGDNKVCERFAKENDYKSNEWCLSQEKYRRWTDCKETFYQKSIERMKNYMRKQNH